MLLSSPSLFSSRAHTVNSDPGSDKCSPSCARLRMIREACFAGLGMLTPWLRAILSISLLLAFCSAAWATAINFGQDLPGSIASPTESVPYTFTANAGDVVNLLMVTTSGTLIPKVQLNGPTGATVATNYAGSPFGCGGNQTGLDTVLLTTAGTYTVIVSDCNATGTGDYRLYLQRTNNPGGASTLPFEQPVTGTVSLAADSNTYTFAGNAGDEIDFTFVVTSGTMIPAIAVYNSNGELNASTYAGDPFGCGGNRLELNSVDRKSTRLN